MNLQDKPVSETRFVTSKIMEPTDANFLGKVFGGSLLSLLDLTAYATASRFAGAITVTASFDRVDFHEPIEVGEMVVCEGFVTFVGRTSMEITIEVYAENIFKRTKRHTNTARVTMVALADGKPTPVPRLVCETRADKERFLEGKLRRELRSQQVEESNKLVGRFKDVSEAELDRLMTSDALLGEIG